MKRFSSTNGFPAWGAALFVLLGIFAGNSYLYADTHLSSYSHASACSYCLSSNSKEEGSGNQLSALAYDFCFSHAHCQNQTISGTFHSLFYSSESYRFKPFENILVFFQFTASIFRPPKAHI